MTNRANSTHTPLKFLLVGGWVAIKNATISCLFVVPINLALVAFFYSWQEGLQSPFISADQIRDSIMALTFLLPVAIIISSIPAFLGGVILAWFIIRDQLRFPRTLGHKLNFGALIGACTGLILILSILIPGDFVGRNAHGGIGYDWSSVAPLYLLYSLEFLIVATIAGARTDLHLRKHGLDAKIINTA